MAMHIDSFHTPDGKSEINIRLKTDIRIPFTPDTTLQDLTNHLVKNAMLEQNQVQFFSIGGSKLPMCEKIKNNSEYPVLL